MNTVKSVIAVAKQQNKDIVIDAVRSSYSYTSCIPTHYDSWLTLKRRHLRRYTVDWDFFVLIPCNVNICILLNSQKKNQTKIFMGENFLIYGTSTTIYIIYTSQLECCTAVKSSIYSLVFVYFRMGCTLLPWSLRLSWATPEPSSLQMQQNFSGFMRKWLAMTFLSGSIGVHTLPYGSLQKVHHHRRQNRGTPPLFTHDIP